MINYTEVVFLVMAIGYSPSGASGANLSVLKFLQPSMKECLIETSRVNETYLQRKRVKPVSSINRIETYCITSIKETR